ncbi:hypothetical protein RHSIM_Rhsim01G0127900 [Rhododendron simsii]|uniref:RRM domain-containing protein n=1 Tax=Rhododendron simsii TaxID=118357 RepID=A0A834HHI9_RHOSS|nr:hypothetical protein RHSIM_Rhsim01G0127900 [Rhododendron simsii]
MERSRDRGFEIFSLFIDNLPKDTRKIWIYNLFSRFGKIRDLYIPNKTSRITGQKFGFVRFGNRMEAVNAAEEINGPTDIYFCSSSRVAFVPPHVAFALPPADSSPSAPPRVTFLRELVSLPSGAILCHGKVRYN